LSTTVAVLALAIEATTVPLKDCHTSCTNAGIYANLNESLKDLAALIYIIIKKSVIISKNIFFLPPDIKNATDVCLHFKFDIDEFLEIRPKGRY
jgi:hypothetical protein